MCARQALVLVAALAFSGILFSHLGSHAGVLLAAPQNLPEPSSGSRSSGTLGERSKIEIIRDVSGEFAKAVLALPRGGDGFVYRLDKPLDTARLHEIVRTHGVAVSPGDRVQITKLDLESKRIVLEINGGGKKKFHLREHLQIGVGNTAAPVGSVAHPGEGLGSTLVLDYGKPLPEMTPEDLKNQLSPLLDFGGQASATVAWIDTVPPEFKKAIQEHEAAVGMDEDMVIAALGRPERKVRERDTEGRDTEDWIYGDPPAKTVFVTFAAGKVIQVKDFND